MQKHVILFTVNTFLHSEITDSRKYGNQIPVPRVSAIMAVMTVYANFTDLLLMQLSNY